MIEHNAYPVEALRLKLLGLGIPHDQHGDRSLMAFLPVSAEPLDDLDANGLAEVLIYLISKNLIKIPSFFEDKMRWGAHVCYLYRSPQELLDLAVPYLRNGLEHGEYCIWIVSSITVDNAQHTLSRAIPRFSGYQSQIELHRYEDWYLDGHGELRTLEEIMSRWLERQRTATERGFKGLRVSGDSYGLSKAHCSSFMKYETAVHSAWREHKIKAICTYPSSHAFDGSCLDTVISSHGAMVTRNDDGWHWTPPHDRSSNVACS